ncbi:MAG: hypothetical protein V1798_10615 [Pseudomonadota bacterium]
MAWFPRHKLIRAVLLGTIVGLSAPAHAEDCSQVKRALQRAAQALRRGDVRALAEALLPQTALREGKIVSVLRSDGTWSIGVVQKMRGNRVHVATMKNGFVPIHLDRAVDDLSVWDRTHITRKQNVRVLTEDEVRRLREDLLEKNMIGKPNQTVPVDMDYIFPPRKGSPASAGASRAQAAQSDRPPPARPVKEPAAPEPSRPLADNPGWPLMRQHGLLPKYPFKYGDVEYEFGEFFLDDHGRLLVLAKVRTPSGEAYRVYLRSNSHGPFQLAPAVRRVFHTFYDKGLGKNTMNLPSEVQEFLARRLLALPSEEGLPVIQPEDLRGIIPFPQSPEEFAAWYHGPDHMRNTLEEPRPFIETVAPAEPGAFAEIPEGKVLRPQFVRIANEGERPDYSRLVRSFKTRSPISGDLDVLVYHSKNGTLEYMLFRDASGHAWFGDVSDLTSEITTHGVRRGPIASQAIVAPRYQYWNGIPEGYHGPRNPAVDGVYFDQWNYVRELPEIQAFYASRGLPVPLPVSAH